MPVSEELEKSVKRDYVTSCQMQHKSVFRFALPSIIASFSQNHYTPKHGSKTQYLLMNKTDQKFFFQKEKQWKSIQTGILP